MRKVILHISLLLLIGNTYTYAHQSTIDSLWQSYHSTPNFLLKLSLLNEIAYEHHTDLPDSTIVLAQQAQKIAEDLEHAEASITSLHQVALGYWTKQEFEEANMHLALAKNKIEKLNDASNTLTSQSQLIQKMAGTQQQTRRMNYILFLTAFVLLSVLLIEAYFLQKAFRKSLQVAEPANSTELATNSTERKDEFCRDAVVTISHEISTPVNAILGFSELLLMPSISEEDKVDFLESVIESCNRISGIMTSLIEYSWLIGDQLTVTKTTLDINGFLRDIHKKHLEKVRAKGLELTLDLFSTESPIHYKADSVKIYQIISALIDNAIKYTEEGRITVGYKLSNYNIEFYVKDTGIGVAEEDQYKIFQRFHRSDKDKYSTHGAGLGLALCQELVGVMGGVIWVESERNQGATFKFSLPFLTNTPTDVYVENFSYQ